MKFSESSYNPLKTIFAIMDTEVMTIMDILKIKCELDLGGIHPEDEDEFNVLLEQLVEFNPRKYGK